MATTPSCAVLLPFCLFVYEPFTSKTCVCVMVLYPTEATNHIRRYIQKDARLRGCCHLKIHALILLNEAGYTASCQYLACIRSAARCFHSRRRQRWPRSPNDDRWPSLCRAQSPVWAHYCLTEWWTANSHLAERNPRRPLAESRLCLSQRQALVTTEVSTRACRMLRFARESRDDSSGFVDTGTTLLLLTYKARENTLGFRWTIPLASWKSLSSSSTTWSLFFHVGGKLLRWRRQNSHCHGWHGWSQRSDIRPHFWIHLLWVTDFLLFIATLAEFLSAISATFLLYVRYGEYMQWTRDNRIHRRHD